MRINRFKYIIFQETTQNIWHCRAGVHVLNLDTETYIVIQMEALMAPQIVRYRPFDEVLLHKDFSEISLGVWFSCYGKIVQDISAKSKKTFLSYLRNKLCSVRVMSTAVLQKVCKAHRKKMAEIFDRPELLSYDLMVAQHEK